MSRDQQQQQSSFADAYGGDYAALLRDFQQQQSTSTCDPQLLGQQQTVNQSSQVSTVVSVWWIDGACSIPALSQSGQPFDMNTNAYRSEQAFHAPHHQTYMSQAGSFDPSSSLQPTDQSFDGRYDSSFPMLATYALPDDLTPMQQGFPPPTFASRYDGQPTFPSEGQSNLAPQTNPIFAQNFDTDLASLLTYQHMPGAGNMFQDHANLGATSSASTPAQSVANHSAHSQSQVGGYRPSEISVNAGFGLPATMEQTRVIEDPAGSSTRQHFTDNNHQLTSRHSPSTSTNHKKQKKLDSDKNNGAASGKTGGDESRFDGSNQGEAPRSTIAPPVKNACLACRTRKGRCDGAHPICGQCTAKGRECVYVKSRRGGARRRKDAPLPPAPDALKMFLRKLDSLQAPQGEPPSFESLNMGGEQTSIDPAIVVRTYAPDDVDAM